MSVTMIVGYGSQYHTMNVIGAFCDMKTAYEYLFGHLNEVPCVKCESENDFIDVKLHDAHTHEVLLWRSNTTDHYKKAIRTLIWSTVNDLEDIEVVAFNMPLCENVSNYFKKHFVIGQTTDYFME